MHASQHRNQSTCPKPAELRRNAEALSDSPAQVIPQEDTFFNTPKGRLKLRQLAPDLGQLVYYERTRRLRSQTLQLLHLRDTRTPTA